ncbi:FimB/Mfa2 family fimbrial subunit [Bacteroides sp. 519]|uniref:FimB/Mfa2 family fimbrial subunit n=1 Tax=Bacteroides sp. 519 TaxID=2302937 RepID=UPI0013D1D0E3|nr:FimB/Mfa2 family fimbrial subunit [Bacteroides sp. 519]NDV60616.1 hypothetical protein [Bacteroides sp. 519]
MRKRTNYIVALALVMVATLVSCKVDQKEPIYEPGGEITQNPGRVKVQDPNGQIPNGQQFTIINEQGKTVATLGNNDYVDLEAGRYYLLGYTGTEYFTLNGATRSLSPSEATLQLQSTDGILLPEGLVGGISTFIVIEDQVTVINVSFSPLTRKLCIEAQPDGIDLQNITQTQVTLSGLAAGINLYQGFGAVAKSAGSYTAQSDAKMVNGKLVVELNLLGMDVDADQMLTIKLTANNDKSYHVTMSLKQILESFNSGSPAATFTVNVRLSADNEETEGSLSGTIIDWEEGEEVEIVGEN